MAFFKIEKNPTVFLTRPQIVITPGQSSPPKPNFIQSTFPTHPHFFTVKDGSRGGSDYISDLRETTENVALVANAVHVW